MKKIYFIIFVILLPFTGFTQKPLRDATIKSVSEHQNAKSEKAIDIVQDFEVQASQYFDVSQPLTQMKPLEDNDYRRWKNGIVKNGFKYVTGNGPSSPDADPVWQKQQGTRGASGSRGMLHNFDGANSGDNSSGVAPPDTQGDVGPNHYVQMVNSVTEIFDKSGNTVWGPTNSSVFWDGFTGSWTGTNDGDPIVLYDQEADRWLVSQFAVNTDDGTQWELLAVSTSPDPTGTYYRYAFQFTDMPDYPKLGIWPDGYYMAANRFTVPAGDFNGTYAAVFERSEMLAGNSATMQLFSNNNSITSPYSMLPSDCDGTFPTIGTPNYFCWDTDDDTQGASDRVKVWAFATDWGTPANSTFAEVASLPTAAFNSSFSNSEAIDQPAVSQDLGTLADRMMFRAQYRKFTGHESIVLSRTVNLGSDHAGVRWYELRKTTGTWNIYQQGTYAPDADSRWMSSIAMNGVGDIALGFSVSGVSTYPSIRYTGRLSGDPLGTMTITEQSILTGTASQTEVGRWGDYSMMSVDPVDDFTFWYTQEYTTGGLNWRTRIASFDFPLLSAPLIANITPSTLFEDRGKQITITGTDLLGSSFAIGGITGSILSNNGTTAVVNFPSANYANGTLTVTNSAGSDTWPVTVNTRNTIPVDASTGSNTDIHQTIDGAVDGLAAWYGNTAFSSGELPGTKTIEVASGTYSESVTINSILNPTAANKLVIKPSAGALPVVNANGESHGFDISTVDNTELVGFTVYGASSDNIFAQGDNVFITMNKCYGSTGGSGIKVQTGTPFTISNNLCYGNYKYGIHLNSTNNAIVKNNTADDNGAINLPATGVQLFYDIFTTGSHWTTDGSWSLLTGTSGSPSGDPTIGIVDATGYVTINSPIDVTGYTNLTISNYARSYNTLEASDILYGQYSFDNSNWTTFFSINGTHNSWVQYSVSGVTPTSNNLYLKFVADIGVSKYWAVDDIKVSGDEAGPSTNTGAGLYVESGTGTSVQNNIFQAKSGNTNYYALISETGVTVNSNFNTYYTTNTNLFDYNGAIGNTGPKGPNDLITDPKFVGSGDYHLFSTNDSYHGGEWPPFTANSGTWTADASDSPALDAGNPTDDFSNEVESGFSINQGAYGNTVQASKSGIVTVQWTGATSTSWTTASNWNPATVPTSYIVAVIPSSPAGGNFPEIPANTDVTCNSLTIQTGATVIVHGTLTVDGNLIQDIIDK